MGKNLDFSLYFITDPSKELERIVEDAIMGGATVIQYRDKLSTTAECIQTGRKLLNITKKHRIPLIVNDRVDVALIIGADGVHVGEDDVSVLDVRTILGPDKIIGATVASAASALLKCNQGADYLGTEAVFPSHTKTYASSTLGLKTLREIVNAVPIPEIVVAVGGINQTNITQLMEEANPAGIAVVSAIMRAEFPKEAAKNLRNLVEKSKRNDRPNDVKHIVEQVGLLLDRIRESKPLIHHITNFVVMNDTVTLYIGATPVMAHAPEEVEEMVSHAKALVLNPGTLTSEWVNSMRLAGKEANKLKIPVILDPVGVGATAFRTKINLELLRDLHVTILKGNSGEIGTLAGESVEVKGVDSVTGVKNPSETVYLLAKQKENVVVITGPVDYVSDGKTTLSIHNGNEWLSRFTGSGCIATSLIGAFAAVTNDPLLAAVGGLGALGVAAEMAAEESPKGVASFKIALFDILSNITSANLLKNLRIKLE